MSYSAKTSSNLNLFLIPCDTDGNIPASPEPIPLRYISTSLEGSSEVIENTSKLPGRNPGKPFPGTKSNAGDVVQNMAPLEPDKLLAAVLCSENGFVKNNTLSDASHDVFDMIPGNTQRIFAFLKEFSQAPKLYQLFRGVQVNTLGIDFQIGSLVPLTFGLMGSNDAVLEDTNPVDMTGIQPVATSTEFITLSGSWSFKPKGGSAPTIYIDGVSIQLNIDNGMTDLQGLFQTEAIDKALGMLNITGTIEQYLGGPNGGELYNLAKAGGEGELVITINNSEAEYKFIIQIAFDNASLSDADNITQSLPFTSFGTDRFILRKTVPAAAIPVTGVSLNKSTTTIEEGSSEQLIATVAPPNADNQAVTWSSSDDTIAAVDQSGNVLGVATGTVVITVTTQDGGFTATCSCTIKVSVTGVTLDQTSLNMTVGDTEQLTATVDPANATNQTVVWASDDPAVATVDQSGLVEAVGAGQATITVTTDDGGYSADCTVDIS